MALVRDPYFWKRFSTAVHLNEESKGVQCTIETPVTEKQPMSWLEKERRKSKRSLIWGFIIFFCLVLLITGGVVLWWLSKHDWLQSIEP